MKSTIAFFVLFSLLLLACSLGYARKEPGDYWKSIMKDQPMPKAIKDLFHQESDARKMNHFNKDFDLKPNIIIYHSHTENKKANKEEEEEEKSLVKQMKPSGRLEGHTYTQQQKDEFSALNKTTV